MSRDSRLADSALEWPLGGSSWDALPRTVDVEELEVVEAAEQLLAAMTGQLSPTYHYCSLPLALAQPEAEAADQPRFSGQLAASCKVGRYQ